MISSSRFFSNCIIALWAVTLVPGLAQTSSSVTDRLNQLSQDVSALPDSQPWQKLKKATLEWALEDAKAANEQGFSDRSNITIKDVEVLLPKDIGHARNAPQNLFVPISNFETNPFAKGAFDSAGSIEKLMTSDTRYAKGDAGNIISDSTGWVAVKIAYEGEDLVEALCHPQSPLAGDPRLIAPMFRRFENAYEFLVPGNKRVADFGDSPPEALMYLELKSVYPDLILPSRQAAWEQAIRVNSDAIVAAHETTYTAGLAGTCYVNSDVKYTSALGYAGLLFSDSKYAAVSQAGVRLIKTALYPDGGFPYINFQNENFTYHAIAVAEMTRLWQVTGNPLCREIVEGTRNYYPLSIEPPGLAEYSSSSSWKHYWHGATAGREAYIIAQLTGDAQNMRVALMNPCKPELLLATVYQREINPAPLPDNYLVYDRNIQGPRGRFGPFSFCGSARDYKNDVRGKSTYVGCMVSRVHGPSADSPLSALDTAGTEILLKPISGSNKSSILNLSQVEHNTSLVTSDFAAISTVHSLTSYSGKPTDWQEDEGWLFTPHRMVGLVSVECLKDQTAYGISGFLQYLQNFHGGNLKGSPKQVQAVGSDSYTYGMLNTCIHEHSYPSIQLTIPENTSEPGKYARLVLSDQTISNSGKPTSYAKGTKQFYLTEVYPQGEHLADQVSLLNLDHGLMGFLVKEGNKNYRLVFNSTENNLTCSVSVGNIETDLQLHRDGEEYRPAWIEADGKEKTNRAPESISPINGSVQVTIPAWSKVVLVSTSKT